MFLSEKFTMIQRRKGQKKAARKTKLQEFIEMEANKNPDDLETERRLSKKLKVKGGKLGGPDDGMNDLFDGIMSALDTTASVGDDNKTNSLLKDSVEIKKHKRKKNKKEDEIVPDTSIEKCNTFSGFRADGEQLKACSNDEPHLKTKDSEGIAKYVVPHLRHCTHNESEELSHIRRSVRGLLNRLSESNVESITEEITCIFRSISRSDGCQIIGEEVLSSCSNGPRGNEQYASAFAAFVAGMACSVGVDFSAKLLASLATLFERKYTVEDNLSVRNITLLLCYLCIFGVCSSDLIYDFLSVLSKRLTELDVSTILTILQCCGMKLRVDDPTLMKDFILDIQRVSELKTISGSSEEMEPKIKNKRMEFMLETICDIKNNKKRSKDDPAHHTRIKKWLQKLKADDVLLRGLKWTKLLDPNKKGQWWLSGEFVSTENHLEEVAIKIDKESMETQKLMQLAAAQRMNTDVRRAIFCIIVSGEDYIDAFEKILRLNLSGKQDREIMRVLLECCLQERVFNKYYSILASKLCSHDKNHKFTLQYCIWDHFKELDSMELRRSMNLAKFVSEMLSSFSLSMSLLKTVDLTDPKQLTPKRIMHFRMLFEAILDNSDSLVWNIFSRVVAIPEKDILCQSIEFFIRQFVLSRESEKSLAGKFKTAKKALNNVAGILM